MARSPAAGAPRPIHLPVLVALCLVMNAPAAAGETVYVTDRLRAGLHAGPAAETPVLALMPSGTALEVLAREGDRVRVRTPGGAEGWVDAAFLAEDTLTRELEALRTRNRELEERVEQARAQAAGQQGRAGELRELEQRLASERLRAGELEQRLARSEREAREAERLRTAQAGLQLELQQLRQRLDQPGPVADGPLSDALAGLEAAVGWKAILLAALVALAAAFLAGVWFMDWRARRRHGGFRV